MNLNPKHHNPELLDKIDEYYDARYDYTYCDSCDTDDDFDYNYDGDYFLYTWVTELDGVVFNRKNIKNFSDYGNYEYDVYYTPSGDMYPETYTFDSISKHKAFFGMLIRAYSESKKPSIKLTNLYDKYMLDYPDTYLTLLHYF